MQIIMLAEKWAEFLRIEPRCQRTLEEFEGMYQDWIQKPGHDPDDPAVDRTFYSWLMVIGWPYGDHQICPHCNERGNLEPKELPSPDDAYLWDAYTFGHAGSCPWANTLGFQVFQD